MDANSRSHLFNYLGLTTNTTGGSSSGASGSSNTTTTTNTTTGSNSSGSSGGMSSSQHQASLDCRALKQMLDTQSLVDCTLACDGGTISAHKVVLSACSTYLAKILLDHPVEHPIIILPELSIEDVRTLIHYMYTGELLKPSQNTAGNNSSSTGCSNSISLLRTAAILSINSLIDLVAASNNNNIISTHHLQPFHSAPINLLQLSAGLGQQRPTPQASSIIDQISPLLANISQQQQQQQPQQQKMFQFQANCLTNENPLMINYNKQNNLLTTGTTATATTSPSAILAPKPGANLVDFGHNAFGLNSSNFALNNYNYTATSLNSSLTSSSASFGALSSSSSLLSSSSSASSSPASSCSPSSLSSSPQQSQQQQHQHHSHRRHQHTKGATPSIKSTNSSTIVDQLVEGIKSTATKASTAATGASTPLDCSSSQSTGCASPVQTMPLSALSLPLSATNINQSAPLGAASAVATAAAASASLNDFQFKCPACQNNFQTICSFEYHMQRVHNVTSFGCELCHKPFASLRYVLTDHMRRCHGWKGRDSAGTGTGSGSASAGAGANQKQEQK